MNDLKTIRQLVKLMVDNDLSEVDLESENEKIKLKRGGQAGGVSYLPAPAPAAAPAGQAPAAPATPAAADDEPDDDGPTIDSPMVGTFYAASSPDAEPFVKAGDSVKADTVICIVEAMKVFNEIKAEQSGTIAEVLVESGQAVEYGQPLFRLK
jgi:acetyl-CoA carboxylase biotin carboxyl carrier protein